MGRIGRFVSMLIIVLGALFPAFAVESGSASIDFILRPSEAANYEVGFSSSEVEDYSDNPSAFPEGIILKSTVDEEEGTVTGANDDNATWFYWKVLSSHTITISIESSLTLTNENEDTVDVNVRAKTREGTEEPIYTDDEKEYAFYQSGIGNGRAFGCYRLSLMAGPISLSDIQTGSYRGNLRILIEVGE